MSRSPPPQLQDNCNALSLLSPFLPEQAKLSKYYTFKDTQRMASPFQLLFGSFSLFLAFNQLSSKNKLTETKEISSDTQSCKPGNAEYHYH